MLLFDKRLQELSLQATAEPYDGYAAISAGISYFPKYCLVHTKQYFVCKAIQLWLDVSAIIALVYICDIGVDDGCDGYSNDDLGDGDVLGYDIWMTG